MSSFLNNIKIKLLIRWHSTISPELLDRFVKWDLIVVWRLHPLVCWHWVATLSVQLCSYNLLALPFILYKLLFLSLYSDLVMNIKRSLLTFTHVIPCFCFFSHIFFSFFQNPYIKWFFLYFPITFFSLSMLWRITNPLFAI